MARVQVFSRPVAISSVLNNPNARFPLLLYCAKTSNKIHLHEKLDISSNTSVAESARAIESVMRTMTHGSVPSLLIVGIIVPFLQQ